MSEPGRTLFLAGTAAWIGALALALVATAVLFRRLGRDGAWPAYMQLSAVADLFGPWAGGLAVVGLFWGRRGYGWEWATALGIVAVAITASLYDRAVLNPSLDAAHKRLAAGDDAAKWEADWRFLWRMAVWSRAGTLAGAVAALVCGLA